MKHYCEYEIYNKDRENFLWTSGDWGLVNMTPLFSGGMEPCGKEASIYSMIYKRKIVKVCLCQEHYELVKDNLDMTKIEEYKNKKKEEGKSANLFD